MLSRPALSIRRLINQKKQAGVEVDEDPFYLPDEIDAIKAAYKDGKGRTWKTSLMRRPASKLTFDIPRSEDIHRISLIPPFPDTPHSSRSSLCSCENGASQASPRSSPGIPHHRSPRSSPLLRPQQADHMYPARGSSRSPSRMPMEAPHSPPPTPQPSQYGTSPEPDSDLSDCNTRESSMENGRVSQEATEQYLDKLIRETDEAFKLQDAFVDAKLPSPGLPEHREAFQVQDEIPLPLTPTRPTRARSQRLSQSSLKSATKAHVKPSLAPNAARSIQNSKTKRTRSKKSRKRSRAVTSQASRWGISESAKDFTLRLFSRIEADEMLPESTLREIRMSRASQKPLAKQNESVVTGVETDKHGARIDSPYPRAGNPSVTEQVDTPRSSVSKSEKIDRDSCATPKPEPQPQEHGQHPSYDGAADAHVELEDDEDTLPIMMMMDDSRTKTGSAPVPPPPKRSPPRRLPSRQLPPLPTIPEIIATGPDNSILSPTSMLPSSGSTAKINKDDYIFLPTTRYTITMPTFCHGPVRLAKADLPIGKFALDDTLDWTAFQMAILGGAGDFFSEPTDYSRPSEAELDELEDIASWFAGFGLGGPGALVTEEDSPLPEPADRPRSVSTYKNSRTGHRSSGKRRSSRISPRISSSQQQRQEMQERRPSAANILATNSRLSVEAPIPVIVEPRPTTPKPSNPRNSSIGSPDPSSTASTPRQISPKEMGFQPLMAEAQPRRNNGGGASSAPRTLNHIGLAIDSTRRPSVDSVHSLPQSPMLDLVVSRDVEGNEYVVPMGFNLGHDLGDFLKWEADNVYAPGYGLEP
ncbi:hypothetical protein V8F33_000186 [Rhypophila sp. PSN 637]